MKKRALFIDRDGTLVVEPPIDLQLDNLEKLEFVPRVFRNLYFISQKLDFEFVMVTNQDGLGTDSFPEKDFLLAHNKMLQAFAGEGITFDNILIDKSFPHENRSTRKPGIGMMSSYLSGDYDLDNSFVIGDRLTDVLLAKNMGCKAILMQPFEVGEPMLLEEGLRSIVPIITTDWDKISEYLFARERTATITRKTAETDIEISINLDGTGKGKMNTGLGFFDHMLDQIARHSGIDLSITCKGDLNVDQHHTIEDTAIVLGEVLLKSLGNKRGIERYGFTLPMDDSLCSVALDFGGRSWLVWDVEFKREMIGEMPTEMFYHFFKSLSDGARMNLNIKAEGTNEHHKIEGIFKAFAKSIKMAIKRDIYQYQLPSTKESL